MTEILTHATKELAERILRGVATPEDFASEKPETVLSIKRDSVPHYRMASVDEPEEQEDERSFRFLASDETPDRSGDVIRVKGWDFKHFKSNPVALWGHDSGDLPIGSVFGFEKGAKRDGSPALFESIKYATHEQNPKAEMIYRLVRGGIIKAVSVGFIPTKTASPDTEEKRAALGLGPYGVLYEKQEQIELSQCSIPCNPNALMSAAKAIAKDISGGAKTVNELLDALGMPAKIQITVPELPTERAPVDEPAPEAVAASVPTQDNPAVYWGTMKDELMAELAAIRKEVRLVRKKLAVMQNRSSENGKPPATADHQKQQPKKTYDSLFLEGLRDALAHGKNSGGKTNQPKQ